MGFIDHAIQIVIMDLSAFSFIQTIMDLNMEILFAFFGWLRKCSVHKPFDARLRYKATTAKKR